MDKKTTESIINSLAETISVDTCPHCVEDKDYGCEKCINGFIHTKKPILIGDVLEKFYMDNPCPNEKIYLLWCDCGLSKSLQEIVESGWEEGKCKYLDKSRCSDYDKACSVCKEQYDTNTPKIKVLKQEVEALLSFIKSLELK